MKRYLLFYILAAIFFCGISASVAAAGCKIQGTWINFDENGIPGWVASSHGQSNSSGTSVLEYPAFTLGDPNVFNGTQMRGAWKRTGGRTFDYTMMGYDYNADGYPLYIVKMSGTMTIDEDCDTSAVTATINIFVCDYSPGCPDPYTDTPDDIIYYPTTYAKRVMVE
jgi:hypothetical protein